MKTLGFIIWLVIFGVNFHLLLSAVDIQNKILPVLWVGLSLVVLFNHKKFI